MHRAAAPHYFFLRSFGLHALHGTPFCRPHDFIHWQVLEAEEEHQCLVEEEKVNRCYEEYTGDGGGVSWSLRFSLSLDQPVLSHRLVPATRSQLVLVVFDDRYRSDAAEEDNRRRF